MTPLIQFQSAHNYIPLTSHDNYEQGRFFCRCLGPENRLLVTRNKNTKLQNACMLLDGIAVPVTEESPPENLSELTVRNQAFVQETQSVYVANMACMLVVFEL